MILQFHWQYKDGHTEFKAQREVASNEDVRACVKELKAEFPLPEGSMWPVWLMCEEGSEHFVKAAG
jgi:hypothetical protein